MCNSQPRRLGCQFKHVFVGRVHIIKPFQTKSAKIKVSEPNWAHLDTTTKVLRCPKWSDREPSRLAARANAWAARETFDCPFYFLAAASRGRLAVRWSRCALALTNPVS